MSRPKRMTEWFIQFGPFYDVRCGTLKEARRRARRFSDPSKVKLVLRCYRKTKKFPRGFERTYTLRSA